MAKKPSETERLENERRAEAEKKRRDFIRTSAGYGLPPATIAALLDPPMDPDVLAVDYAAEIETGKALADLEAVSMLRAGIKKGNMTAIIWWTKVHLGWTEKGPRPEKPEEPASNSAPPTTMPSARQLSAKILGFPQK